MFILLVIYFFGESHYPFFQHLSITLNRTTGVLPRINRNAGFTTIILTSAIITSSICFHKQHLKSNKIGERFLPPLNLSRVFICPTELNGLNKSFAASFVLSKYGKGIQGLINTALNKLHVKALDNRVSVSRNVKVPVAVNLSLALDNARE